MFKKSKEHCYDENKKGTDKRWDTSDLQRVCSYDRSTYLLKSLRQYDPRISRTVWGNSRNYPRCRTQRLSL